jgi:hypothetical protein
MHLQRTNTSIIAAALLMTGVFWFFGIGAACAQQVCFYPPLEVDQCVEVDTFWIYLDAQITDVEAAHFKVAYDHTHLSADAVFKFTEAETDSNVFLSAEIYPDDSIIIDVGFLIDNFDGPGRMIGLVFTAGTPITQSSLIFEESVLRDPNNDDILHTTASATVETFCCCRFRGDLDTNEVYDVLDVVLLIDYIFRNGTIPLTYPGCPTHIGEINCDDVPDVLDVVALVDVVFRNFQPIEGRICNPCLCDPYPSGCP